MALKFDLDNYQDLIKHFQDQKHIKSWSGTQTIKPHNLLHRAAKVPVIIDCVINAINKFSPNSISQHIHLESMRNGMYEDLGKTILNDLSKKTKLEYPDYAKHYEKILKNISADLNLSKNSEVLYIAQIGDILNSYFEAKLENNLGNNTDEIIYAINNINQRFNEANNIVANNELKNKVLNMAYNLVNEEPEVAVYNKIIETTQNQTTVERWAKRLSLNDFTLLEHSARVTALVDIYLQINKQENNFDKSMELNIFRYSLYHDYPEVILNDMPSPVKQMYPNLDKIQKQTEKSIMDVLDLTNSKNAKFICKIADIYDCYYESNAEILAGNKDPEYITNKSNYENTYYKQLNKYKDYIEHSIISNIQTMYFDPVLPEINQSVIDQLQEDRKKFMLSLTDYIINQVNNEDIDSVELNKINELLNDLSEKQKIDLTKCVKNAVILGDIELNKFISSGIQLNIIENKPIMRNHEKNELEIG